MDGMGGSAWHQRPAGPNTMWRIVNRLPKPETDKCLGQMGRQYSRTWGIAELDFFKDDDCEEKIVGGTPIPSGTIEYFRSTPQDALSYHVEGATDGSDATVWAANCRAGWKFFNTSRIDCAGEWIGMDFGTTAVEVKCVQVIQSRLESTSCCDPASEMELQRWNGTAWKEATWVHVPPAGDTGGNRHLGAYFKKMGECPASSDTTDYAQTKMQEMRARRDSDKCLVPTSGATTLMAKPFCIEHPRCTDALGGLGDCCPIEGGTQESRCCCSFFRKEPLFIDEEDGNVLRNKLDVEAAIILVSDYLPFVGGAVSVITYIAAVAMPASASEDVRAWAERGTLCGGRLRQFVAVCLWPLLAWRSFLQSSELKVAEVCCWFCLPGKHRPYPIQWPRAFFWIFLGVFAGGVSPWVGLACLFGQVCIKILHWLSLSVKWAKSPFDTNNDRDMIIRDLVAGQPIKDEEDTASASDVAVDCVSTLMLGMVYFLKFIFDMLILRSMAISYGHIESIDSDKIVDVFPGLIALLKDPGRLIYQFMYWASQVLSILLSWSIGIPKCEGSCVLIGSVALIMVLIVVCQWLNYDYFGLFAAARQVVKTTRPECQRTFMAGLVMGCMSAVFASIQCAMVLFARAVTMANPFRDTIWYCEYDDTFALYLGRGLITLSAMIGIFFVFLCINGHFMGQDYIVKPLGKFLGMRLERLDPDGQGLVRIDVLGAAIPTLFGVWLDAWNVRAFIVHPRAHIYAQELQDPQPCQYCDQVHVKYDRIMCATGRQVSLAIQVLPYGSILGKLSEYANDPPLFYCGTCLPCMRTNQVGLAERPDLGKNKFFLKFLLFSADTLAYSLEYLLPLGRRVISMTIYVYCLLGTFTITEENLITHGADLIMIGFYLSLAKAAGETVLESLLSFGIGLIYQTIHRVEGTISQDQDLPRAVAGQIWSGAFAAATATGTGASPVAIILGGIFGYAVAWITLGLSLYLEKQQPREGDPPTVSPTGTAIKMAFSMLMGALVTLIGSGDLQIRGFVAVTLAGMALQIIVLKLILVEERRGESIKDSATYKVMATVRVLPALVAIPFSAIIGGEAASRLVATDDAYVQVFTSLFVGLIGASFMGLTINKMMNSYPTLFGGFAAVLVCALISIYNFLVGVFFGAVVGGFVGSILEQRIVSNKIFKAHEQFSYEDQKKFAASRSKTQNFGGSVASLADTASTLSPLSPTSRRTSLSETVSTVAARKKKIEAKTKKVEKLTREEKLEATLVKAAMRKKAELEDEEYEQMHIAQSAPRNFTSLLNVERNPSFLAPLDLEGIGGGLRQAALQDTTEAVPPPLADKAQEALQDGAVTDRELKELDEPQSPVSPVAPPALKKVKDPPLPDERPAKRPAFAETSASDTALSGRNSRAGSASASGQRLFADAGPPAPLTDGFDLDGETLEVRDVSLSPQQQLAATAPASQLALAASPGSQDRSGGRRAKDGKPASARSAGSDAPSDDDLFSRWDRGRPGASDSTSQPSRRIVRPTAQAKAPSKWKTRFDPPPATRTLAGQLHRPPPSGNAS